MTTVNGYTAERTQEIENQAIVSGAVVGDDLILTRFNGGTINAGNVRGAVGPEGPSGVAGIEVVTSGTRPGSPYNGQVIYETDTDRFFNWDGVSWVWACGNPMRCKVKRTTNQSFTNNDIDNIIWNSQVYDTDNLWDPGNPDRLVIPANGDGLWRFNTAVQWDNGGSGARNFAITKNDVIISAYNSYGETNWLAGGSLTVEEEVVAGDLIRVMGYQNSAGILSVMPTYPLYLSAIKIV